MRAPLQKGLSWRAAFFVCEYTAAWGFGSLYFSVVSLNQFVILLFVFKN
jgi:hypothetical protein